MRIISKFHDYYDCIQRTGQDQSLLYLRNPSEIIKEDYGGINWWAGQRDYSFHKFTIGFCGRVYRGVRVAIDEFSSHRPAHITFCYSEDSIFNFLSENLKEKELVKYTEGEKKWRHSHRTDIIDYFSNTHTDNDLLHHFSYASPIWTRERVGNEMVITLNGQLKKFEFFRVLDPFQAFQELSMYLGGLAVPDKPLPKIDDKTMAEIKGFDKYSFRKDKS